MTVRIPKALGTILIILATIAITLAQAHPSESSQDAVAPEGSVESSCARSDVPCLVVPRCESGRYALVNRFYLTKVPAGTYADPADQTEVRVCYNATGFRIRHVVYDKHVFSPFTKCNDNVWEKGDVLETFIAPVHSIYDVPKFYWEVDGSPNSNLFVALIENANMGNTTCRSCKPGPLPCQGAHDFPPHKFSYKARVYKNAQKPMWTTDLFIPFTIFPESMRKSKLWRGNFYRYDYPQGETGPYQLSGWSPTFNGSFHIPTRFGVITLE